MALEVKVYGEITSYQAKVILGMTWRQLLCSVLALVFGGGTFAMLYVVGLADLGQWIAAIIAVPFGAIGWVRPKGLPFEKYASYVINHQWQRKVRIYAQRPVWLVDQKLGEHRGTIPAKQRRAAVIERGR